MLVLCLTLESAKLLAEEPDLASLYNRRVLVLGDSITYGGHYVACMEAALRLHRPDQPVEIINLGLPSETVSGLSEQGHAGGRFPRPDLHERLDRVLEKIKPDVVIACYGMNCGIYHPYGVDRFEAFKVGIRRLRHRVLATGAVMIHVTPPVFDPVPIAHRTLPAGRASYNGPYEGYDEVLALYAAWLVAMRGQGWTVIDIHGPMKHLLNNHRRQDPSFRFAGDGIHMNPRAHWLTAQWILEDMGLKEDLSKWASADAMVAMKLGKSPEWLKLIKRRQRILGDAWLRETGHLRPGMAKGLPLAEGMEQGAALEAEILAGMHKAPQP